jgi:hypothetical protein
VKETDNMRGNEQMTDEQATYLKNLSEQAFEPEAFRRNLDRAEAERRIAALKRVVKKLERPEEPVVQEAWKLTQAPDL